MKVLITPYIKRPGIFTGRLILALLISIGMGITACSDNSTGSNEGNSGGGGNDGGNTAPTFANVQAIFNGNCATSGCHNASSEQSGVNLSSYNSVINSVGSQYGKKVIQPNDAAGSPLVDKISSDNPQFGSRMPLNSPPLSDDQINLIRQWIDEGAQNN